MRCVVVFCLFFLSCFANASEHFSDHESYCLNYKAENCYALLQSRLKEVSLHSKQWYKIKSYQLDYYYDKREFKALEQVLTPLVDLPKAPDVFKVQVYFYYAKVLGYFGKKQQAKHYADLAITKLEKIYHVFEDPMRMLELANLQHVFGEGEKAYQILLLAGNRFAKRADPIFHFELNSNKGHIFYSARDFKKAARFYQLALDWVTLTEHPSKISVALGNLARAYQNLGEYQLAKEHFLAIAPHFNPDPNDIHKAIYILRTAEVCWQLRNFEDALHYLKKVNHKVLGEDHSTLFMHLSHQLNYSPKDS